MTQLIDFDELKQAFSTKNSATVKTFFGKPLHAKSQSKLDNGRVERLSKENDSLREQVVRQVEQYRHIEGAYQKALRQLNSLNQDQQDVDSDFQRLHEDKIRLIRSLNSKQNEIEKFKKTINLFESTERTLRIKLSHSKHSANKYQRHAEQQIASTKNKDLHILQLKKEIEQLKHTKPIINLTKDFVKTYSKKLIMLAEYYWQQFITWKIKSKTEEADIRWIPVATRLPKQQCMVHVRNGSHSDVAIFNPKSKNFKCTNSPFTVKEWAMVI